MVAPAVHHRETLTSDLRRAIRRAADERIVVFRRDARTLGVAVAKDGALIVKPYILTITGERCGELACDCPAGKQGRTCKHLAAGLMAMKYHVFAKAAAPASVDPRAAAKSAHELLMECFE